MSTKNGQDLKVIDAMEKQTSGFPNITRIASLFKETATHWKCCCIEIGKKKLIEKIGKFILFVGMMCYIIYQLDKYFDTDENREESVDIKIVDTMPMAFIYIDYEIGDDTDCDISFGFYDATIYNTTYYNVYNDWGNNAYNIDIQSLFDYVDDDNNCKPLYIQYQSNSSYGYLQHLFIPPSGTKCSSENIDVESKSVQFFEVTCPSDVFEPSDHLYWTLSGNRQQLNYYSSLGDALDSFFSESSGSNTRYQVNNVYDWYSYDNQIDDGDFYDYFDISVDGSYATDDDTLEYYGYSIGISYTRFSYSPNDIGIKTTFVTKTKLDLLDIFGLAGGMHSSIKQILGHIMAALIWGCSIGCFKLKGVDREAGPDGLTRQKLEGFLKARDETIVELTQRIVLLEKHIGVKQIIDKNVVSSKVEGKQGKTINRTEFIFKQTTPNQKK